VWLTEGSGQIIVNDLPLEEFLPRESLIRIVHQPFAATETQGRFDVKAFTRGGGLSGQAGALRHGIAKALVEFEEEFRAVLRRHGYLTRDPRVKERKKAGFRRARRGKQFSKR
jgi:small subunit ribosomal protein S9